ncbi:MAG: ribbon-helix-helix domain-containing protein [Myxacorys californica WJT36-NPBG1]|jgi:predicted transcriptional regulator|nr:ribbon-helix-helix domain-containing protein [Myxacorys californica WJT36-NPBG1]
MSEPKPTIAARVSLEVKQQIDRMAESTHSTASKIVETAIENYLGMNSGEAPLSRLDAIEQQQLDQAEKLAELRGTIAELQQWREKLRRRGF